MKASDETKQPSAILVTSSGSLRRSEYQRQKATLATRNSTLTIASRLARKVVGMRWPNRLKS